jgi:hypothetical protein
MLTSKNIIHLDKIAIKGLLTKYFILLPGMFLKIQELFIFIQEMAISSL